MCILRCYYLLRGVRWQQLEIVSLVPRYPTRQEDGVDFSVALDELDRILGFGEGQGVVRETIAVAMLPRG